MCLNLSMVESLVLLSKIYNTYLEVISYEIISIKTNKTMVSIAFLG